MGGKKGQSEGLGRALIRQHNVMVQQSKDKGRDFRLQQRRNFLESVTEISDIDTVLQHADEAADSYSLDNPLPDLFLNLDASSEANEMMTPKERREQQKREEALHASSLRVPRRPTWNAKMSFEELDANEKQSFLVWRRSLARLEENENLILTPFEKNLDIWRQLWRVLERSDLLVMVVDARDPLFYRCPDLEAYARETDKHKKTMLLVNKADLLPLTIREKWATYFRTHGILFVFWSAKAASAALEGKKLVAKESVPSDSDSKIYGRDELLSRLQAEAEAIASLRESHGSNESDGGNSSPNLSTSRQRSKNVVVGFVGYPNVGKSSTINALVGEKRTGVTSTPGKTKHFQTLIISEDLVLCDCPGLVFPSFSSSRHEMVASGVLPIDRLVEHREALQVVANRVPRDIIEGVYNITLPKPKPYEPQSRPPWASELLRAYCSSRGHVSSSGLPDETRGTRQILKDFIDGKLPHFELPPGLTVDTENGVMDGGDDFDDSCDSDDGKPNLQHVLEDLESFELGNAQSSKSSAAKKKSAVTSSYKHHKKPQKKKDRSWRVGNDGGDGMPVVRVFQKPAVNFGVIKASN